MSESASFSVYVSMQDSGSNSDTSNPNQFNHDIGFKSIPAGQLFSLSSALVPDGSFTAAVEVHGYAVMENQPISNIMHVTFDGVQDSTMNEHSDLLSLESGTKFF